MIVILIWYIVEMEESVDDVATTSQVYSSPTDTVVGTISILTLVGLVAESRVRTSELPFLLLIVGIALVVSVIVQSRPSEQACATVRGTIDVAT